MANMCLGLGTALIVLGLGAYLGTGRQSVTAMIPAFFGALLATLGLVARDERKRKHAMHAAVLLGLLGFAGSVRGVSGVLTMLRGGEVARPVAAIVQATMAVLCAIFLGLAVRSFAEARRARKNGASTAAG
jgi:hypothetical protein